ncbi:MAG TPA: TPM domain-containing protein [Gemmatimonadaceae bacterium]
MAASLLSFAAALLLLLPQQPASGDAGRLRWVPDPTQATRGWVSDPAHHLAPATVARIDSIIFALERASSVEMAVVVIDSLDGLTAHDAALLLHRRWGVGKGDRNNGLVLLWSPAARQVAVSVGYGLEGILTDAMTGRIEDEVIIPLFRKGEFDTGIAGGVAALAAVARRDTATVRIPGLAYHPPTSAATAKGAVRGTPHERGRDGNPGGWWRLLFLPLAGAVAGGALFWRRRPRRCPEGHGAMHRLAEAEDDAALPREARLEEELRSVDYDVWRCATCGATEIVPWRNWFSRYRECASCHRRTASSVTQTIAPATRSMAGLARVVTDCRNCGAHSEKQVIIPQLPEPSSSRSSFSSSGGGGGGGGGGSSFGGGSAGGGGASRGY